MDKQLVKTYLREFGEKYYQSDIFEHYPEARIIPGYIQQHFSQARSVLDLGFGSGLWFWASFLPALERIDGIDLYAEALEEADRVFQGEGVPAGFRIAHERLGQTFTPGDLRQLQQKRGRFHFLDYRQAWPEAIAGSRYDLVTEHGGGLGQMNSDAEVVAVMKKVTGVLKPAGHFLFVNMVTQSLPVEERLDRVPDPAWCLDAGLYEEAVRRAGLEMVDFQVIDQLPEAEKVDKLFYGYARK